IVYQATPGHEIGGLVIGKTYYVESVANSAATPVNGEDYVTHRIRLALSPTLDLGGGTNAGSTHSLDKPVLVTVASGLVGSDGAGILKLTLPGVANGTVLEYLGPSGSNSIDFTKVTYSRSTTGDSITIVTGTAWS